jgi:integrase
MVDLGRRQIRVPDFRIIEKYTQVNGEWQRRPVKVPAPARTVTLSPEAVDAWRRLLAWHNPQNEDALFTRFGYFPSSRLAAALRWASQRAGLDFHARPLDFGGENHPDRDTTLKVVTALRETKWLDGAVFRKTSFRDSYIRACVLAFTGMRVGELALLQPADLSFDEKVVKAPTEKKGDDGRRKVIRRRIPLGAEALAALQMFHEHRLYGGWEGVSGVPDQIPPDSEIVWYNGLYRTVRLAAARVVDSVTGEPVHFHPHVFRHSFATAIVNERDASGKKADLRTAQHVLGHSSLTTTARYVRPSEETARQAIEHISSTATTLPSLAETDVAPRTGLRLVSMQ